MKIKNVTDKEFAQYGRILDDYYEFGGIMEMMEQYPVPDDVVYVPSVEQLETGRTAINLRMRMFGELPIQIGYCIGKNTKLNALEYHRSSEVDIAVTDMILLLGRQQDIQNMFHMTQQMWKRSLCRQEPEWNFMRQRSTMHRAARTRMGSNASLYCRKELTQIL